MSDTPDSLAGYTELRRQADAAWAAVVNAAESLFTRLRTVDPELAELVEELFGSERAAAIWFIRKDVYENRPSRYAELAAGKREEVRDGTVRVSHGMF